MDVFKGIFLATTLLLNGCVYLVVYGDNNLIKIDDRDRVKQPPRYSSDMDAGIYRGEQFTL